MVGARLVWAGAVVCLAAFPVQGLAQTAEAGGVFDDVHRCDDLAAHPDDPNRWAAGVADGDIIPGPAVKFCQEAVADHPATPRFQFQLGRALWAAGRMDEGVATFLALEGAHDYPPVYAYLGEAFYQGIGGVEVDEGLALSLFDLAAAADFAPAVQALEDLTAAAADAGTGDDPAYAALAPEPEPAPETAPAPSPAAAPVAAAPQAPPEIPFDPAKYAQPDILRALATGNLSAMQVRGIGKTNYAGLDNLVIYINNFHSEFSGSYNMKDPTCVALYDPMLERQLVARATRALTGGSNDEMAARGLNMLGQMLTDMTRNDGLGSMMAMQQDAQALAASGSKDGAQLIIMHGCQSEIVQRIYANVAAYAFGRTPVQSEAEKARVAQQEAQKRETEAKAARRARVDGARKSCLEKFKQEPFCGCVIADLETRALSDQDWTRLGRSFAEVLVIAKSQDGFADRLTACRQKG